jgi:hypothetical protein
MTDPHQKLPIKWRAVQRPEWVESTHSLNPVADARPLL